MNPTQSIKHNAQSQRKVRKYAQGRDSYIFMSFPWNMTVREVCMLPYDYRI